MNDNPKQTVENVGASAPLPHEAPSGGRCSGGQRHQRLLCFQYRSTFELHEEAARLGDAATELVVADRPTITGVDYRVRQRVNGFRLDVRWSYGWVRGGWPSDGERFVRSARTRAGLAPACDESLAILREQRRPVAVHGACSSGLQLNQSDSSDA